MAGALVYFGQCRIEPMPQRPMTFEEQFRPALDNLSARLRRDVARHLDAAVEELTAHAEKLAASTETERAEELAARDAARYVAWNTARAALLEGFEAERATWTAALDSERAQWTAAHDADQARAIDQATRAARADAERATSERLGESLAEAEARAHSSFQAADLAAGDRLVHGFRVVDAGRSLSDILGALFSAVVAEATRVAMFTIGGGQAKSWRLEGFEPAFTSADHVQLALAEAGVIADAVLARTAVLAGADGPALVPAFAALPDDRGAVAVPLVVNDEVVMVLYADQGASGDIDRASWAAAVEVLARHAARALEAVTAHRLATTLSSGETRPRSASSEAAAGTLRAASETTTQEPQL